MAIPLYMDENVHGNITEGLRRRGVDVRSVQDDGLEGFPDGQVLDRATVLGRLLFTQDEDLLAEAARRQAVGIEFHGVAYGAQNRITVRQAVDDLELIARAGQEGEFMNIVQHLPLR
jgi:predicted nuclease of predicted toxin-antitoxin system